MFKHIHGDKKLAVVVKKCSGTVLNKELGSVRPLVNADYIFLRRVKKTALADQTLCGLRRPFTWRKKWERDWPLV